MSDVPPAAGGEPSLEQRLGLVLRGVQRMADGLGAVEQRLPELATAETLQALSERVDEYRVRSRTELSQVHDLVTTLATAVDAVLRDQQALRQETAAAPAAAPSADLEPLTEAVRALRDDLAESHRQLVEQTKAAVERVAGEQAERALRTNLAINDAGERTAQAIEAIQVPGAEAYAALQDELAQLKQTLDGRHVVVTEALAELRQALDQLPPPPPPPEPVAPPPPPYDDTPLREAIAALKDDLAAVQGEIVASAGQVRTDLAARLAGTTPDGDVLRGIYDRLGGIEWRMGERLDPLVERVAALEQRLAESAPATDRTVVDRLAALDSRLDEVAQREDVRRGVERVVGAVTSAEHAVTGHVKAVDARVGAIAEEVSSVRALRDGLRSLAENVDVVRQLASRGATSSQMGEVTKELQSVLAEIESARSQVLQIERSSAPVAAEVVAVGTEVDDLGKRIDQLAQVIEEKVTTRASADMAERLRSAGEAARQLGNGVLEDLRSRRGRRR